MMSTFITAGRSHRLLLPGRTIRMALFTSNATGPEPLVLSTTNQEKGPDHAPVTAPSRNHQILLDPT